MENPVNLQRDLICLTTEDELLIELLVEGELDETVRRDLLFRLDRIVDGWRFCAISFLESQCIHESLCGKTQGIASQIALLKKNPTTPPAYQAYACSADLSNESLEGRGSRRKKTENYWKSSAPEIQTDESCPNRRSRDFLRDFSDSSVSSDGKEQGCNSQIIDEQNGKARNREEQGRDEADRQETSPGDFEKSKDLAFMSRPSDFGTSGTNLAYQAQKTSNGEQGAQDESEETLRKNRGTVSSAASEEPLIIPMKKGGYSQPWMSFSKRLHGGDGPTWRHYVMAMAGGFLLAIFLTGMISVVVVMNSSSIQSDMSGSYGLSAQNSGRPSSNTPSDREEYYASQSPTSPGHATTMDAALPIQVVTLKSSDNNLNGIRVPCYESQPSSEAERHDSMISEEYLESLRQNGCQVETVLDDLVFPLEDGRVLIVPVDTVHVQESSTSRHFQ